MINSINKVFGLGFSKTGTLSLTSALNSLGIRTIHFPYDKITEKELFMGSNKLSILDNHQAITDISIIPFYKNLDKSYPGSKFIMTKRETNSWLRSIKKHLTGLEQIDYLLEPQFKRFSKRILNEVYGSSFYDKKIIHCGLH